MTCSVHLSNNGKTDMEKSSKQIRCHTNDMVNVAVTTSIKLILYFPNKHWNDLNC